VVMNPGGLSTKNDCAVEASKNLPDQPLHCSEWPEGSENRLIENMVISSVGLGTKNRCSPESQLSSNSQLHSLCQLIDLHET
jgi:hypothetical protein